MTVMVSNSPSSSHHLHLILPAGLPRPRGPPSLPILTLHGASAIHAGVVPTVWNALFQLSAEPAQTNHHRASPNQLRKQQRRSVIALQLASNDSYQSIRG